MSCPVHIFCLVLLIVVVPFFFFFVVSYVSELIYVHSKVMIVDDRRVIVNSFLPCLRTFPKY